MSITKLFLILCIGLNLSLSVLSVKMEKKESLIGLPVKGTLPNFSVTWFNTGFQGTDIGCGAEGDVYVVGTDGKLYFYQFLRNMYTEVEGDLEIPSIARVDVDAEGTPYIVTSCGQLYYLNCYNKWVQLPGCGTDIGVGRGGDIWKVGCDDRAGGYGIWKLFCKCNSSCGCERSCIRFRPMHYLANAQGDIRKCFWYRIEGGAVRVDVDPYGNPWVLTSDGVVYGYDGVNWDRINGVLGRDITVSNDNMKLVAGLDGHVYSLQNASTNMWVQISGTALEICAAPFSQPWVVGADKYIYSTSKFDYN